MVLLLLVGLGAGVTAALLFATLATGQAFAVGLFYLTPLPILLAAIVWNHIAGAIAALTAALILGSFLGGWFVLAFTVGIGLPAYLLGYLALLGRSDENGEMEWYPPGRLVLAGALIAATATALSIPALGTDIDSYRAALKEAFERVFRAQTDTPTERPLSLPGIQDTQRTLELLTIVMPPAAAVVGMVTSLANLWLAGRVARVSGRLARPWPDLAELRFPPAAPLLLAVAVAGTFLPGLIAVVAGLFAATLLVAYALLGFAIVHHVSRRYSARLLLLTAMWLAVFMIGWPILIAALIGLADSFIDFRARFGAPSGGASPT
ncbi:MAG TPA: DUF2232 domain-containing protein [Xanthobacteraceae bacterium]|nr:DUF2232 domain-containing protein [Xanthobacteraceae bacterium]